MIYWSIALGIFFAGLIVTLENTYVYWLSFVIWGVGLVIIWIGLKRKIFIIEEEIYIYALIKHNRHRIPLVEVKEMQISKKGVLIITTTKKEFRLLITKKTSERLFQDQLAQPLLQGKIKRVEKIDFLMN